MARRLCLNFILKFAFLTLFFVLPISNTAFASSNTQAYCSLSCHSERFENYLEKNCSDSQKNTQVSRRCKTVKIFLNLTRFVQSLLGEGVSKNQTVKSKKDEDKSKTEYNKNEKPYAEDKKPEPVQEEPEKISEKRDELEQQPDTSTPQPEPVPESAPTPLLPTGGELTNPSMGVGLNGITDWSTQYPFLNIMKTSRKWVGHVQGRWGAYSFEDLEQNGHLDSNGYVRSLPEDAEAVEAFILTEINPEATYFSGRYRLAYEGEGEISVVGHVFDVERRGGQIEFSYTPDGEGAAAVRIASTNPSNHIRNISIVKLEHLELFESGEIFNPLWIELIKDMRLVRFMDWMQTNNSQISLWSQRPTPNDYTYAMRGAPVEVMVSLANKIGADPWFNMPHLANDQFIERFAVYVRDNLRNGLKAHFEYSNEVWNFIFRQAQWANEQAESRWNGNGNWMEFAGMKAAQMAQVLDRVYGEEAQGSLVKVIGTHTGWKGLEEDLLNAPAWVSENPGQNRAPYTYFDAYAVTGYFGYENGLDENFEKIQNFIRQSRSDAERRADSRSLVGANRESFLREHQFDLANTLLADDLKSGSLKELTDETFPYHAQVAERYGMSMVMYEGGTHVAGVGEVVNNQEFTDFFTTFNYSPEAGELYELLLNGWRRSGGTVFNAFVDVARATKWGSWGHKRHLEDKNTRWDSLMNFNEDHAAWWDDQRPQGVFLSR